MGDGHCFCMLSWPKLTAGRTGVLDSSALACFVTEAVCFATEDFAAGLRGDFADEKSLVATFGIDVGVAGGIGLPF